MASATFYDPICSDDFFSFGTVMRCASVTASNGPSSYTLHCWIIWKLVHGQPNGYVEDDMMGHHHNIKLRWTSGVSNWRSGKINIFLWTAIAWIKWDREKDKGQTHEKPKQLNLKISINVLVHFGYRQNYGLYILLVIDFFSSSHTNKSWANETMDTSNDYYAAVCRWWNVNYITEPIKSCE